LYVHARSSLTARRPFHATPRDLSWACVQREHGIIIVERKRFEEKMQALCAGGASKLQFIADFDRTLTPYKHKGSLLESWGGIHAGLQEAYGARGRRQVIGALLRCFCVQDAWV